MNRLRWGRFFFIWPEIIVVFLGLFFGVELLLGFSLRRLIQHDELLFYHLVSQPAQRFILIFAMFGYGIWRTLRRHPAFNSPYRRWLASTPWTAAMPLPLGTMSLVWQDALLLATAAPLAIYARLPLQHLLSAFCAGYAAGGLWALVATQQVGSAYVIVIGFAVMVRCGHYPYLMATTATALAALASIALQRSLRHFPWKTIDRVSIGDRPAAPFDRLGALRASPRFSHLQAILIGLLVAACAYVITWAVNESDSSSTPQTPWLLFALLLIVIRLVVYLIGYVPPISILGRFFTGRLVIWGFDKILVAPAAIGFIFWSLPPVLSRVGCTEPAAFGITMGLATTAMLGLGPSLNEWRLTGAHRILLNLKASEQTRPRVSS